MDMKIEVGGEVKHVVTKDEKQNSFEFRYNGVGSDVKVYFKDAEDLNTQIENLKNKAELLKSNIDKLKEIFSVVKG